MIHQLVSVEYHRMTMKLPNAAVNAHDVFRVRMYIGFFYDAGMNRMTCVTKKGCALA